MPTAYESLSTELRQIATLHSISSVLGWDERTVMPDKGTRHRGDQSALIAGMAHERYTAPKVGDLLKQAASEVAKDDRHSARSANVRETLRRWERAKKLPTSLVEEIAKTVTLSEQAWSAARRTNDFKAFKPWLEKMYALKRQEIACYGIPAGGEAYDAVLEDYEPGQRAANLRIVFDSLKGPLVELVGKIVSSGRAAPLEILQRSFPVAAQEKFAKYAAEKVGFDFSAGVLDVSSHPFCSGLGPGDTRMTTRYDERYFGDAFFGTLHETGHALYDQGLPDHQFGLPAGDAISLGIHESQSRMWENLVGRSRSFWTYFLPKAREHFPEALKGVSDDEWFRAVNDVRPSLIRTESDEATYNLHILIRFELETALLEESLKVDDLPAVWAEKYKKYLGIEVPTDADGCMQDVHWGAGLIGYFPTYTLGNLYAAQFFDQARKDIGDLDAHFAKGDFAPLLTWLRKNIHSVGQRYTAPELIKTVTGKDLDASHLLNHLKKRAAEVYGV